MSVEGKTVLITGGGSGVGADMARHFAEAGARVVIAGRRAAALDRVAARHRAISPVVTDVTDEEAVAALFKASGSVDVVIANAGMAESAPLVRTSLEDWNRQIAVNLTGVFLTLRAGLAQMKGRDWGRLIAVASTAGLKGYPYVAAYTAAKHGAVGLIRATAQEVAKTGVTANALCPGFLDTEMTERSIANIVEKTGMSAEKARARLVENNPQRRLIAPAEVSAAALWLCAPGSESINGQAIAISGGEI